MSKAKQPTAKQVRFVDLVLSGEKTADAYRKAYGKEDMSAAAVSRRADEVLESKTVQGLLKAGRERVAKAANVTSVEVTLFFAATMRNEKVKVEHRLFAADKLAKILGMYSPKKSSRPVVFNLNLGGEPVKEKGKR